MCLLFFIANVEHKNLIPQGPPNFQFPIQVAKTGCGGIRPGVKLKRKAFF